MDAHEYAAQEQAKHKAAFDAFVSGNVQQQESVKNALLEGNARLGTKQVPGYADFLQNMGDPFSFLRKEVEDMRWLLLQTNGDKRLQACQPERLPVIFTFTGEVNAEATACPEDGTPIIRIDMAVYHWLVFVNRMLMRCTERGTNRVDRKKEFLETIRPWTDFWLFGRSTASLGELRRHFTATLREPFGVHLSTQLTDWHVLWILAHEMAHVALGHTLDDVAASDANRRRELDADSVATRYLLNTFGHLARSQTFDAVAMPQEWVPATPLILLMYFSYAETVHWGRGGAPAPTHPLARDRGEALVRFYDQEVSMPTAATLGLFAQIMVMRASFAILDERGHPRPTELPPEPDLEWDIGERLC